MTYQYTNPRIDHMEPGIYTNFFQVEIQDIQEAGIVFADAGNVGTALELRGKVKPHVHQVDSTVYGFGPRAGELASMGFSPATGEMLKEPRLVSRLIVDAFLDRLHELGYTTERSRIRHRAYHPGRAMTTSMQQVKVIPGCMVRSSFFKDQISDATVYGLSLDPWFRIELEGRPSNFGEIRRYASSRGARDMAARIVPEMMMKIGMLTPYQKRNRESFKMKVERMLSLVAEVGDFSTGGSICRLVAQPTKVIMQE